MYVGYLSQAAKALVFGHMSNFIIQLIAEHVPAPLLWAAAGAASCCAGLSISLYFANPMAYEVLMADEDDDDAQNIGQPTLNMFSQCVIISGLLNSGLSFYDFNRSVSIGCCGLSCVIVGLLTAWYALQHLNTFGQSVAKESREQRRERPESRAKED